MKNKYFNHLKANGFYLLLLLSVVCITLVLALISYNGEQNIVEDEIDLNEEYVEDNDIFEKVEILNEDSKLDMEDVTNVVGDTELGDNFLIVKESKPDQLYQSNKNDDISYDNHVLKEEEQELKEEESTETFMIYNNEKDMLWPATGEVIMPFSMDRVIYDKNLDQYRTNDSIVVACELGTEIKVAADGIVEKIDESPELGKTIIVDHGNGWKTVYGQLNNNLNVKLKQQVKKGQVLGQIAEPTKYYNEIGTNFCFKVIKGDGVCNPLDHLVQ